MERRVYKKLAIAVLSLLLVQGAVAQTPPKPPAQPAPPASKPAKAIKGNTDSKAYWEEFDLKMKDLDLKLQNLNLDLKLKELEPLKLDRMNQTMARLDIKMNKLGKDLNQKLEGLNFDFPANFQQEFNQDPAADNYVQGAVKSQTINKTYSVSDKDKLAIDNQYGNVKINVWAKKEIKVDVEIKAFEATDSKAQDLLESVSIAESRQSNLISFKTNFQKGSMSFWTRVRGGKEERRGIQVNYTIYMPANNPLDITNRYGSINLPDFSGPVNINNTYGSLTAQKLDNPANRVKASYGSVKIDDFSSGNLDVAYGNLNLGRGDKINANIRYGGSSKIGRITTSANIDLSYADGFKIERVDKNVKNLAIDASYSQGLSLGMDPDSNFDFDVTVSHAGFSYKKDGMVTVTSKSPDDNERDWGFTKNYKGRYGKGSDSRIIIKSNYGSVKFL
ncbi:MAG TPA: hypothetical protein VEV16_02865 [Daejeonella sp.]|nr:hypothetical protein [Daejeonella sp.]